MKYMELPSDRDPFKITRRDFFASIAMQAIMPKFGCEHGKDQIKLICKKAFEWADSMQDARKEIKDE